MSESPTMWIGSYDSLRVLSGVNSLGKGRAPFQANSGTPASGGGSLYSRATAAGVSIPASITTGFASTHPHCDRSAWLALPDLIDEIRAAEGAGAFSWTKSIYDAGSFHGSQDYRNECAVALERWTLDCPVVADGMAKSGTGWWDTWENACAACEDASPGSTTLPYGGYMYGRRAAAGGPPYYFECYIYRSMLNIQICEDDVAGFDSVSATIRLQVASLSGPFDDWGADQNWQLYKGTGLTTWNVGDFVSESSQSYGDGSAYVDFKNVPLTIGEGSSRADNFFIVRLERDQTTADGTGTFTHPSAPASGEEKEEGAIQWNVTSPTYSILAGYADAL